MTKFKIPKGYKIVTSCIIFDPNGVLCFNELTAKNVVTISQITILFLSLWNN